MTAEARSLFLRGVTALLLMAFVIGVLPAGAAAYDPSQRETIRVGFFGMDGYHMMDENGGRSGYGYDFLQLVSRYIDVDYQYIGYEDSWEDMQRMLENGEIDLVTSARKTPEREERFGFSRPIGTSSVILTVRSDNSTIVMHDYSTYEGIRVAMLNGNTRNDDFASFAEQNGFSYIPVYFDTSGEMTLALQSGTVDAVVTSSLRQTSNERVIEKFDSDEFYAIVKKGNVQLLSKINYAIDQMNVVEGDWKTELHNRYYENYNDRNLAFTREERAVIRQYNSSRSPLTVVCDPTRYPYSYVEDGRVKGILPDYFRALAEYIGINCEFVPCESREEYLTHRSSGSADLCIDFRLDSDDYSQVQSNVVTAPYLTLRMAMVTRSDFDGEVKVVSTVAQSAVFDDAYAKNAEKLICETREKAMEAVLNGKADAAYVYYYTAQAFVNRERSGALACTLMEDTTYKYHIAVSPNVNHMLSGILTKAIYAMPSSLVEDISDEYTSFRAEDLTLMTMIQLHPVIFMIIVLALALAVIAVFGARSYAQRKMTMVARQKAEEMTELANKAEAASRAKGRFLSNMSHDIRTPLNGIIGLLKIDEAHLDDTELLRANHEKMMASAGALLSLVSDVLQMSELEDGELILGHELTDMKALTYDIVTVARNSALDAGITWHHKEPGSGLPYPYVYGSPLHLRRIFLNIYGNCVKYTPRGGSITTTVEAIGGDDGMCTYRWTISDTGIGMSLEFVKQIFEPFAQEKSDARTAYEGTGLGMSIVKGLVERMKGSVEVESRRGEGTTVVVTIPFETAPSPKKDHAGVPDHPGDISGLHFMLAEDNMLNSEIAETLLKAEGASVTAVRNGRQAVELFEGSPAGTFDVILMDIMMPEMDGLAAARAIRRLGRPDASSIPIIAMTANAFRIDAEKCLAAGMDAHLTKPLDVAILKQTVAEILSRQASK